MHWEQMRQKYPGRWLLVEAFGAYTQAGQRIIPHLELIADFGADWDAAWSRYKALHHADPGASIMLSTQTVTNWILALSMRSGVKCP